MKKFLICLLVISMIVSMAACGNSDFDPVSTDIDFKESNYKHINNGGVTDDDVLPYNIDAITGATMTVEGPGVVTSVPLSVREVENANDGIVRGIYKDSNGKKIYEGVDLYYVLNDMVEGDNGIILTDNAYKVILKNSNRAEISSFTLEEVKQAHDDGRPIILAYGVGTTDGSLVAPFVFDGSDGDAHSLGYVSKLDNDDGCIKLVYDADSYGDNKYKTFTNVAYVYVAEETEPGFKHSETDSDSSFNTSRYNDYILTLRGSALGKEIDVTVKDIEDLVYYKDGEVSDGGLGYRDTYSLANNAYWYVNTYEGVDLYKYLVYLGMDDADTMGTKLARTTLVQFIASDGVAASETFSVDTLSYPDAFGFYNKNAADQNDGTYVSTNADLVDTGYPVLISYGVNNYPYTISKTDDAYLSGLSNAGGPLRVVFGKTQYNHPNGSNQVQLLSEVIAGDDILYNTHAYTDNSEYNKLATETIQFTVNDANGNEIINKTISVADVESLIYGEDVSTAEQKLAKVKDHYETLENGEYESAIYEGVDMEHFLMDYLGLPGTNGTVTFIGKNDSATVNLEDLMKDGYNVSLERSGIASIVAFAKNGSPLVESESSNGYVSEYELNPYTDSDASTYTVDNAGGPLMFLMPSDSASENNSVCVSNLTAIHVDLIADSYAHIEEPYSKLASTAISFSGEGLDSNAVYTIEQIESKQTKVKTLDYSMLSKSGKSYESRYRGISLYELFKEIGIKNNAGDVTVTCADGTSYTYSLALLKKSYDNFISPDKEKVYAMLAYGVGDVDGDKMQGTPLTSETGGPIMLVVPQESETSTNASLCLKGVKSIYVSANEVNTWSHSMSDVYSEFLDDTFTLTIKNDAYEYTHDYTLAELEAMDGLIFRETYNVLDLGECEGIDIWQLVKKVAKNADGIDNPVSVTAYANDDYKNDILSVVYLSGLENGVASDSGDAKKVMLCYAIKGYPNVDDENHEGYTGLAGNTAGPLRLIVENVQGASVKYCVKLVVTLPGESELDINF